MKNIFHNLMMMVVCLGLLVVLQVTFIFFLFAMLPTVVAFFVDNSRKKYIYKTILACNLSGMLPPLTEFMHNKMAIANFEMALHQPHAWFVSYGSAAGGWVLIWTCRAVALQLANASCDGKIRDLEAQKKQMINEWGEDVAGKQKEKNEA